MSLFGFSTPMTGEPWSLLDRLRRDIEGAFQRATPAAHASVFPPVNVYEDAESYVLMAELPGVKREDLQLSIEANRLTLRGERKIQYPDDPPTSVHRRERQAGTFRRTVELPLPVDGSKVEAILQHGVLIVRLPKAEQHRPRRIEVQSA